MTVDTDIIPLRISRYTEGQNTDGYDEYMVPYNEDWVVLDALNYIKDYVDGSLAYRWSCRMGVCGSCGMMINGKPKLTCSAFLSEYYPNPIVVEPLANFRVERDLIVDMEDFIHKLDSVKPWLIEGDSVPPPDQEYNQTPAQLAKYKQYSMCINCTLCYSACPVASNEPEFIGPAAIALAQRYNMDSRDSGKEQRLDILMANDGVWDCTFVGECSNVCPKGVDPAAAIQQAKLDSALAYAKSLVMPKRAR